jgi:hypothetical protein
MAMKRLVVTNRAGDIIATAPYFDANYFAPNDGGPTSHEIIPARGQYVHVVELPDEARSAEDLLSFHATHRVRVKKGKAELEQRAKKLTPQAMLKITKALGRP